MLKITKLLTITVFISLFFINIANAGTIKKITGIGAAYLIKYEAKKMIKNQAKHESENLIKNELKTGSYNELKQINKLHNKLNKVKSSENNAHHIPSDKFMNKFGISRNDAIAINVEKARHGLTRTYKGRNVGLLKNNESPRDALARDIKNIKEIYKEEKVNLLQKKPNESDLDYSIRSKKYDENLRASLKDVIKKNKKLAPKLFKK